MRDPSSRPWRHPHAHHARHRRRHPFTLRRALFLGSFVVIVGTATVVSVVLGLTSDTQAWWREIQRIERFSSAQLAARWDDPAARTRLLDDVTRELELRAELTDARGQVLYAGGRAGACGPMAFRFDVQKDGVVLGTVSGCRPGEHSPPWRAGVAVGAAVMMLWGMATLFARKAARPLVHLVDVARRIGEGDLRARPGLGRRGLVEVQALAAALAEMAERIEQQLKDQRALLAGASHELRTPLGHLRILVELLRQQPSAKVIDDVEREVLEMDAMLEKLLASSRLDFSLAEKRDVDAADLARRALERSGEPADKLVLEAAPGAGTLLRGDPTLLLGALSNLVENARSHGDGLVALLIDAREDEVAFVVDDGGPGIAPGDEERIFEPFFHKSAAQGDRRNGSLGLGLALVKRIAEAHGGRAFATQRLDAHGAVVGARVGFTVARSA